MKEPKPSDFPGTPDDPYGDRAFLAAQKAFRLWQGQQALNGARAWQPADGPPASGDDDDEGGEGEADPADEGSGDEPGEYQPPPADAPPGGEPPAGKPKGKRKKKDDGEEPVYWRVSIPRIYGERVRYVPVSMPDDPPITCLGVQGGMFWYLNPHGELISLKAADHGQAHIAGLWAGHLDALYRAFPQIDQNARWKGFAAQYARDAMMSACSDKGVFEARDKVRGLGCWKGDDGKLILHLGNVVLIDGKEHKPGELLSGGNASYVYPGRPPLLAPKVGGKADCETIYKDVQSWRWARGKIDARLFLGWMACAVLGPALDWRPHVFWIGDAGTGKSSLQERLKGWLPGWMVSTIDASPASLRQIINQDGVAVAFDEIEADMLNDKAQEVMKLARVAASGGKVYRGGADHKAAEFLLRGAFGFSAILPPSMRQQDMQRFAFLRLLLLDSKAKMAAFTPAQLREMGAGLIGRVVEGWPRWQATLDLYVQSLITHGHAHRGAVQFGSLLAAADLLLGDGLPDADTVDMWCAPLKREGLYEYEQNEPTWLTAWRRLLTASPEVWRADGFPNVGQVVRGYVRDFGKSPMEGEKGAEWWLGRLERVGLSIVNDQRGRHWLAIPPRGQGITAIYQGSDMQAKGGEGVWTAALRGAPPFAGSDGAGVWKADNVQRLNRVRCTLYRLDAVVDLNGVKTPIFDDLADEVDQVIQADYSDTGQASDGVI